VTCNEAGASVFQVAPFVEGGGVWNVNGNPNLLPDQRFLITTGLSLLWEAIPRLNLRVDYGVQIIYLIVPEGLAAQQSTY
jgi:hemolysin activation/secretion protein